MRVVADPPRSARPCLAGRRSHRADVQLPRLPRRLPGMLLCEPWIEELGRLPDVAVLLRREAVEGLRRLLARPRSRQVGLADRDELQLADRRRPRRRVLPASGRCGGRTPSTSPCLSRRCQRQQLGQQPARLLLLACAPTGHPATPRRVAAGPPRPAPRPGPRVSASGGSAARAAGRGTGCPVRSPGSRRSPSSQSRSRRLLTTSSRL